MHLGKLVFAQVTQHLPLTTFRRCVARDGGEHKVKIFSCLDQYLCMAFAQLTYRESLRDIEACLRAQQSKLCHMGIQSRISRSTPADANEVRDWRIYADLAQSLIGIARRLYAEEPFGADLKETVYALDASTIDLCLSVFPWAPFRSTKAAIKLHTLLDLRGNIPTFLHISDGKLHDVNVLDLLVPAPPESFHRRSCRLERGERDVGADRELLVYYHWAAPPTTGLRMGRRRHYIVRVARSPKMTSEPKSAALGRGRAYGFTYPLRAFRTRFPNVKLELRESRSRGGRDQGGPGRAAKRLTRWCAADPRRARSWSLRSDAGEKHFEYLVGGAGRVLARQVVR